ncbi:hypothetical protein [Microbacterium testaceum]
MTASAPLGEVRHPLASHGWHMEPLDLIEDASAGPYLLPLAEFVPTC